MSLAESMHASVRQDHWLILSDCDTDCRAAPRKAGHRSDQYEGRLLIVSYLACIRYVILYLAGTRDMGAWRAIRTISWNNVPGYHVGKGHNLMCVAHATPDRSLKDEKKCLAHRYTPPRPASTRTERRAVFFRRESWFHMGGHSQKRPKI